MGRVIKGGVEFIFKGIPQEKIQELLEKTNLVYNLSNSYKFEYVGNVNEGKTKSFNLGKRFFYLFNFILVTLLQFHNLRTQGINLFL